MQLPKDLTKLRVRNNIYYTSNDIIFDIESRAKADDADDCGIAVWSDEPIGKYFPAGKLNQDILMPIINIHEIYNVSDVSNQPYYSDFLSEWDTCIHDGYLWYEGFSPCISLQELVEEGDKIKVHNASTAHVAVQTHPDIYNGSYLEKFNTMVREYIRPMVISGKTLDYVMNQLPTWLTVDPNTYYSDSHIENLLANKNLNTNGTWAHWFGAGTGDVMFNRYKVRTVLKYYTQSDAVNASSSDVTLESVCLNEIWTREHVAEVMQQIYLEWILNGYEDWCADNFQVSHSWETVEEVITSLLNPASMGEAVADDKPISIMPVTEYGETEEITVVKEDEEGEKTTSTISIKSVESTSYITAKTDAKTAYQYEKQQAEATDPGNLDPAEPSEPANH